MSAPGGKSRLLLSLAAGFGLWAAAFVALYAMLSVGCAFGWDRTHPFLGLSLQRFQLLLLFILFLALHVGLLLKLKGGQPTGESRERAFLRAVAHTTAAAALGATLFTYGGITVLTACAP